MVAQQLERCDNCTRPIGELEDTRDFGGRTVCLACEKLLISQFGRNPSSSRPIPSGGGVRCPQCGGPASLSYGWGKVMGAILFFPLGVLLLLLPRKATCQHCRHEFTGPGMKFA